MKTKVKVKDLRIGDQLSACKVIGPPVNFPGLWCGKKDQMTVVLDYGDGIPKTAVWGKYTTVTMTNR